MKVWDLTKLAKKHGIKALKPIPLSKPNFNPLRIETVDCSQMAVLQRETWRSQNLEAKTPESLGIHLRQIRGHKDRVESLEKVALSDCQGLISTSRDKRVLTWSLDLDVWGKVDLEREGKVDKLWRFPTKEKITKLYKQVKKLDRIVQRLKLPLLEPRRKLVLPKNLQLNLEGADSGSESSENLEDRLMSTKEIEV